MNILIVFHIIVTFLLSAAILLQKSEGGASLFSSSASSHGAMTARGTEDFLTKSTWVLSSIFISICLVSAFISKQKYNRENDIDSYPDIYSIPKINNNTSISDSDHNAGNSRTDGGK